MKKLKLLKIGLLLTPLMLVGCKGNNSGDDSGVDPEDDPRVTVNFYIDFNAVDAGEVYHSVVVDPGSKVTKPADPTNPPGDWFTTFVGWSKKEIIDDTNDLWNFDTDTITVPSGQKTYSIYGIWFVNGER